MKPILLDSLYINMGGGRVLLEYLVQELTSRGIVFVLIQDERCPCLEVNGGYDCFVMRPSIQERKNFYKNHRGTFHSVLCFANVPPPVKMDCPVFTYFHNINILQIPAAYSLKRKIITYLKRQYIRCLSNHTDSWIVQTDNTAKALQKIIPIRNHGLYILPFFYLPDKLRLVLKDTIKTRFDYILVGDYTGTRGHSELVEAWRILSQKGIKARLHLTVAYNNPFSSVISSAIASGANIINHGIVPLNELVNLYKLSKATIYPSVNESFGLGILEAIYAGCDVIGADLPYMHAVCKPSMVLKALTTEAIVDAVLEYEKGGFPSSELKVSNRIDDLINIIVNEKVLE